MQACTPAAPVGFPGGTNPLFGALAGELQFAVLPVAEPCFGGIPFTFTTAPGGTPSDLSGPEFAPVVLNPASSSLFSEPIPGVLQYNGAVPLRFSVSFGVTFLLNTTTLVGGFALITALLCLNGVPIQSSASTTVMFQLATDLTRSENTFNGQALITLNKGDQLTICVADLDASTTGATVTDEICIFQVSLLAQQA